MSARSADSKSIQSKSTKYSKGSRQSYIGSAALKARAKAEAAREAAAYEQAIESGELVEEPQVHEQPLSPAERTSDYVQKLSQLVLKTSQTNEPLEYVRKISECSEIPKVDIQHGWQPAYSQFTTKTDQTCFQRWPQHPVKTEKDLSHSLPTSSDLTRHLIRKEMVSYSLLKFDDHAENYWSWKASFKSATKDLNLTPQEELDLLTKWFGPESSEHAKRIRSIHVLRPESGLNMLWLEESYGAREMVEHALLKKLEDVPRLTNRDSHKPRELGHILLELECAKSERYLPGLAYLDTAHGLKPIVEKLPYSLQERWITEGFRYEEEHNVPFPPFIIFSRFVRQQAKKFSSNTHKSVHQNRKGSRQKVPVHVHKTDLHFNSHLLWRRQRKALNDSAQYTKSPTL
ncbi:4-hydroxy-tetrahydrodipicolinate synthase [Labeo rohita]|uniref:4-hydroxy-tetrahydrodipicolinate synthase n=1 Tax=Labeo rohita TaxID=84645 RepID=A0ABQ8LAG2_LABRO|nr:4-hydroxy-tetrahydrodipicolinate synthase [Labeo rohita]